jgi:hypothetical protein
MGMWPPGPAERPARIGCAGAYGIDHRRVTIPVYLEAVPRKTFAGAIDWPGWCRSARDEEAALAALAAYAPRYAAAIGASGKGLPARVETGDFEIVGRLEGNAGTEFGVPSLPAPGDEEALSKAEAERLAAILEACGSAFDAAAKAAVGKELRKGPRGGGRDLPRIVEHVDEAASAYLREVGGKPGPGTGAAADRERARLRKAMLEAFFASVRGESPPPGPRRTRPYWPPRYLVRRAAWHLLDHAWEVEDRSRPLRADPG